jgi:uncharacterized protein YbjT (DUF2867 family)
MKIVVIGGSGLIGTKLVNKLRQLGHEVNAASPSTGVNSITGEGLTEAMKDADVVVDVANSPSFEDKAALDFFQTSGKNLFAAEAIAGVKHHVALSVVGTNRLQGIGYFRAKAAQEKLIKESGIPYSILHATQFFEFVGSIAKAGIQDGKVRMTPALFQPIAADDVVEALANIAVNPPLNNTIEVGGPEKIPMDEIVRKYLSVMHYKQELITDMQAPYFGMEINDQSLTAAADALTGATRYNDWISQPANQR